MKFYLEFKTVGGDDAGLRQRQVAMVLRDLADRVERDGVAGLQTPIRAADQSYLGFYQMRAED
jgi:hypothetical protein